MMLKMLKSSKGFTLMDTMVSISLLPMLFLVLYGTMSAAKNVFNVQTITRQMNHGGMELLRTITKELAQSNPIESDGQFVITDGDPYDEVRFRIPVDWDKDGDVILDGTSDEFEWGAAATNHKKGWKWKIWKNNWIRYRVVNGTLRREILKPNLNKRGANYTYELVNNVTAFNVEESNNLVTVTVAFEETDEIGQAGQSRDYSQTYVLTTQTMMRNIVDQDTGGDGNGYDSDDTDD